MINDLCFSDVELDTEFIPEEEIEPQVCAVFGCPKVLSLIESLCGDKCTGHQGGVIDITNCLSL